MKGRWTVIGVLALGLLLALAVGLSVWTSRPARLARVAHAETLAQGPDGDGTGLRGDAALLDFEFLDRAITTTHFVVHYTLINCNPPKNDCLDSDAEAQAISDILEEVYEIYVNDPNYGFRTPLGTGTVGSPEELDVYIVDLDSGCGVAMWSTPTPHDYFKLDSGCIRDNYDPANLRGVQGTPLHELFHRVQYSYDKGPEEKWSYEGSACTMQDKVYGGPDSLDSEVDSSYVRRANRYLNSPNRVDYDDYGGSIAGLRRASYYAGLFWTYFMQTCGTVDEEPELGMDALRIYWEETLDHDNVDAMDHAIQTAPGCPDLHSMEDLFHEFIVANYVKRLGNVSERYQYADEHGPEGTPYDDVRVEAARWIRPASPMDRYDEEVAAWGANYYAGLPACDWIQVELDGAAGDYLLYAILAVDAHGDAQYYDQPRFRRRGNDLTRTLYNDGLSSVVAIAGAPDAGGRYDVHMRCVEPTLEILTPGPHPHSALVGDPLDPRRFLLRLSVTSDGDHVEGLDEDGFSVQVGGEEASILSGAYVQNQYWLVVQPPTQTVTGDPPWLFDLDVTLEGLSDHEDDAVHYAPETYYDEVLVIDTSGSMDSPSGSPKLLAAQNAAKLYLDLLAEGDNMGAVQFETSASSVFGGMFPAFDIFRESGKDLIDDLTTGGCTSIGGGLMQALAELEPPWPGDPDKPDVFVLLSDGMENVPPCWEYGTEPCGVYDCSTGPYVRDDIVDSDVIVHTVALGPGSHEDLMQRIAADTDGDYTFATVAGTSMTAATAAISPTHQRVPGTIQATAAPAGPQQVTDWVLGLSDIYDYLEGRIEGRARIYREQHSAELFIPYSTTVRLDASITHATFAIAHNTSAGDLSRDVWLVTPGGVTIDPGSLPGDAAYREDDYHDVYEIPSPQPGLWQVFVHYTPSITPPPSPYNFVVAVSGQSATGLEVYIGAPVEMRMTGSRIPLLVALLGPDGLLPGAALTGTVVGGDGTGYPITLRDDGGHGDGEAGDGIYGAFFTRATAEGSYTLHVEGREGDATRQAMASFFVQADADSDGDGMPDGWESRYGLDPAQDDAAGDPDWDYLDNGTEYQRGTNPQADDTDGGGEADDSESFFGTDAINDPDDDDIETPTGFRAAAGDGQVTIHYDRRSSYAQVYLHWSIDPEMADWRENVILIGTSGIYTHTGLINGTTYYYRLVARDATFHYSGYTDRVNATPRADPYPPLGAVTINDGATVAFSRDVVLTIEASDDGLDCDGIGGPNTAPPPEMRLSNDAFFTGAPWEPYATTRSWQLEGGAGEQVYVYVQFRDAAGNTSALAEDGIRLGHRLYLPVVLRDRD